MQGFHLKEGMLLGAASAAAQIEGGDKNNNWYDWYKRGRIRDGSDPSVTTEHYVRWREDAQLMQDMGLEICRFGIDWCKLEPAPGQYDEAVIAHYREELQDMLSRGIRPLMTLHHFVNPMWFEELGAFTKRENDKYFLAFVEKAIRSFGDLVSEYITINEPNVYALSGYMTKEWPPGVCCFGLYREVLTRFAALHIQSYSLIHSIRKAMGYDDTKVSFANHLRVFVPKNPHNPWHRFCTWFSEKSFQDASTRAMCKGEVTFPLHRDPAIRPGEWCDFIAVNYYSRTTVHRFGSDFAVGVPVNDLGWEIYPAGIVEVARYAYDLLPRPIYITENGTCDNTDAFRARYIYEHLKALCQSELPVARYYHWCFCDNFEWLEGNSARFGLVHTDYETQARTVKPSGRFYSEIIRNQGVTEDMHAQYCNIKYKYNGGK
ncbi:MAG: family 1 glycosylhydrolase [Clostridia bacterium]|nr:family 1 glycosylhydrolase [Clostridia bacterium]